MRTRLPVLMAALLLAGCATQAPPGAQPLGAEQAFEKADPLEPLNRKLFGAGRVLDKVAARPVATTYRRIAPRPVRRGVHNMLQNTDEPLIALNDLLQGRIKSGARSLMRFAINSTVGLAGLFDPAGRGGLPHHENGFATTFRRYGVPSGPYLYLPLIGPSNVRGIVGEGLDYAADPFSRPGYHGMRIVNVTRTVLSLIDERAEAEREIQTLFAASADPYATARSVFLQTEQSERRGGAEPTLEELPDLPAAPGPDASPPAASAPASGPPPR